MTTQEGEKAGLLVWHTPGEQLVTANFPDKDHAYMTKWINAMLYDAIIRWKLRAAKAD